MKNTRLIFLAGSLIPLISFLTPLASRADVNMKDASYSHSWTDTLVSAKSEEFRILRKYDSRSLFEGVFGFGWCSDLDASISEASADHLSLRECGTESGILFKPTTRDEKAFRAPNLPFSSVTFDGHVYLQRREDGSQRRFNRNGKLISFIDDKGRETKLIRDIRSNIKEILSSSGLTVHVSISVESGRIQSLTLDGENSLLYRYQGSDLASVQWPSGTSIAYQYDDVHNLTRIQFPDRSSEEIKYDKDFDRVVELREPSGCIESYSYLFPAGESREHFIARSQVSCRTIAGTSTARAVTARNEVSQFEFWHKKRADGQRYLARAQITRGSVITDISFDPYLGHALSMKRRMQ